MSELSTFIIPNMRQQLTFCKTSVFLIMGVTGLVISTDGMSGAGAPFPSSSVPPPCAAGCVTQAWKWCGVSGSLVRCIFLAKGYKAEGFFSEKEKQSKLVLPTYGSSALPAPW